MTIKKMMKKYQALQKQKYESVSITEVVNDLYAILRKKFK